MDELDQSIRESELELSVRSRNALRKIGVTSTEELIQMTDLELRRKLIRKKTPKCVIWKIEMQLIGRLKTHQITAQSPLYDAALFMSGRLANLLLRNFDNNIPIGQLELSKIEALPGCGDCSKWEIQRFFVEHLVVEYQI